MAKLTKDAAIGIMLGLIDRSRQTPAGAQSAAAYLRPREAQLIADYIADLHKAVEVADSMARHGRAAMSTEELEFVKAAAARAANIEAERKRA